MGGERRGKTPSDDGFLLVATRRRAGYDFELGERLEAGLCLQGSEVKSLREGNVSIEDAFGRAKGGELYLTNCQIGPYNHASHFGHTPYRERKLLVGKAQLRRLVLDLDRGAFTLIPTSIYFKRGWAKVSIAIAQRRKKGDKRRVLQEREQRREIDQEVARNMKRRGS